MLVLFTARFGKPSIDTWEYLISIENMMKEDNDDVINQEIVEETKEAKGDEGVEDAKKNEDSTGADV